MSPRDTPCDLILEKRQSPKDRRYLRNPVWWNPCQWRVAYKNIHPTGHGKIAVIHNHGVFGYGQFQTVHKEGYFGRDCIEAIFKTSMQLEQRWALNPAGLMGQRSISCSLMNGCPKMLCAKSWIPTKDCWVICKPKKEGSTEIRRNQFLRGGELADQLVSRSVLELHLACSVQLQVTSGGWKTIQSPCTLHPLLLFCQYQSRNKPLEQVCLPHSLQKDHWKKFQYLSQRIGL